MRQLHSGDEARCMGTFYYLNCMNCAFQAHANFLSSVCEATGIVDQLIVTTICELISNGTSPLLDCLTSTVTFSFNHVCPSPPFFFFFVNLRHEEPSLHELYNISRWMRTSVYCAWMPCFSLPPFSSSLAPHAFV